MSDTRRTLEDPGLLKVRHTWNRALREAGIPNNEKL